MNAFLKNLKMRALLSNWLKPRTRVTVGVDDEKLYTELSFLDDDERARLFIVSKVTLTRGREVEVTLATGTKCERCWNYRDDVHVSHDGHHLCGRCANVIGAIHEEV